LVRRIGPERAEETMDGLKREIKGRLPLLKIRALFTVGWGFKLSKLWALRSVHPWTRLDKTNIRWLPINQDIELPASAPMPRELLDRFIDEASHRVVYRDCVCRQGNKCKSYPVGIGCLQMGDSAMDAPEALVREVGPEEAKEYVSNAIARGLVPVVGKVRIDNFIFGIKDRSRLLTVCFCCECCCITRYNRFAPAEYLDDLFPRLDGISIEVTDDCTGCGTCVEHCYIKAISLEGERAVIGDLCRACGRCATVCPSKAVKVSIDDPEFIDKAYDRIRSYVKYE
jgi:ferredoxin